MKSYLHLLFLPALVCACSVDSAEQSEKKILFVVSNAHYYGASDINTANHFAEIVFAYDVFDQAGYSVDFISPEGGAVPIGYIYSDTLLKKYLYDGEFMDKLEFTKQPTEVTPESYAAIFYAGGGSAMFGVPSNELIQKIAVDIYAREEGIVSAVCHGTAGIANIVKGDGTFLVAGKNINGFPDLFENKEAAYFQEFPFSIEEQIQKNGGTFNYSTEGWDGYLEVDDKIITGQDPTSSALVAQAVIARLEK
ncbi:MAG: type 1 glutamine amidotransferase domain-containing protein [Ekhidna sp.]